MTKENAPPALYLREWRKFRDMTQEQLADAMGYERTVLSKVERGKVQYTQAFLEAAAKALRCRPADIIGNNPEEPAPVMRIWDRINVDDRPRALDVLKAFSNSNE